MLIIIFITAIYSILRIASGVYDLILNTTTNINEYQKVDLTAEDFTNQSWFYVFDNSNDQNY